MAAPMAPAGGTRSSKMKMVGGRLVSARSKTGNPACSQAMSSWVRSRHGGPAVGPAVFAMLGKCRQQARQNNRAQLQQNSGKLAEGRGTWQRSQQAAQLQAQRAAARPAAPTRTSAAPAGLGDDARRLLAQARTIRDHDAAAPFPEARKLYNRVQSRTESRYVRDTEAKGRPAPAEAPGDVRARVLEAIRSGPKDLPTLRRELGHHDFDQKDPLKNPVHAAADSLRASGHLAVRPNVSGFGHPSVEITGEGRARLEGADRAGASAAESPAAAAAAERARAAAAAQKAREGPAVRRDIRAELDLMAGRGAKPSGSDLERETAAEVKQNRRVPLPGQGDLLGGVKAAESPAAASHPVKGNESSRDWWERQTPGQRTASLAAAGVDVHTTGRYGEMRGRDQAAVDSAFRHARDGRDKLKASEPGRGDAAAVRERAGAVRAKLEAQRAKVAADRAAGKLPADEATRHAAQEALMARAKGAAPSEGRARAMAGQKARQAADEALATRGDLRARAAAHRATKGDAAQRLEGLIGRSGALVRRAERRVTGGSGGAAGGLFGAPDVQGKTQGREAIGERDTHAGRRVKLQQALDRVRPPKPAPAFGLKPGGSSSGAGNLFSSAGGRTVAMFDDMRGAAARDLPGQSTMFGSKPAAPSLREQAAAARAKKGAPGSRAFDVAARASRLYDKSRANAKQALRAGKADLAAKHVARTEARQKRLERVLPMRNAGGPGARWAEGSAAAHPEGKAFADRVLSAAGKVGPEGRFMGGSKVFLHHAHAAYEAAHGSIPRADFDRRMVGALQGGHVELSRADLVEAMKPADVKASDTNHLGATYNFLRAPHAGGPAAAPAAAAAAAPAAAPARAKGSDLDRVRRIAARAQGRLDSVRPSKTPATPTERLAESRRQDAMEQARRSQLPDTDGRAGVGRLRNLVNQARATRQTAAARAADAKERRAEFKPGAKVAARATAEAEQTPAAQRDDMPWLTRTPHGDVNFRAAVRRADLPTLRRALEANTGREGRKGAVTAIAKRIKEHEAAEKGPAVKPAAAVAEKIRAGATKAAKAAAPVSLAEVHEGMQKSMRGEPLDDRGQSFDRLAHHTGRSHQDLAKAVHKLKQAGAVEYDHFDEASAKLAEEAGGKVMRDPDTGKPISAFRVTRPARLAAALAGESPAPAAAKPARERPDTHMKPAAATAKRIRASQAEKTVHRLADAPTAVTRGAEPLRRSEAPAAPAKGTAARAHKAATLAKVRAAANEYKTSSVRDMPTSQIHFDPHRFQYKLGHAEGTGSVGSLAGVKRWDPELGGVLQVWKDPADGKTYVVNGHNRLDLAVRLGAGKVSVRHIKAADSKEARATGAIANIAEGRGTSTDAGEFFRTTGLGRADLEARGVPMRERMATEGLSLGSLEEGLWRQHKAGDLPAERAAIIGGSGLDHAQQKAVGAILHKRRGEVSNATLRELLTEAKNAGKHKSGGANLFGDDPEEQSSLIHRAGLIAHVKERLGKEKRLFGTVGKSRNAEDLERAGNKIDAEQSGHISREAAENLDTFERLRGLRSPVADLLNEGETRLAHGENRRTVYDDVYKRLPKFVRASLAGG